MAENNQDQIKYTWKWFEYHADQRMRAFYYFLLIVGALSYGYVYCLSCPNKNQSILNLAPKIAILVAMISIVFLFIELRNLHLVNIGRNKLAKLNIYVAKRNKDDFRRDFRGRFFNHSVWLQFIYWLVFFVAIFQSGKVPEWRTLSLQSPEKEIFIYALLPFSLAFYNVFPKPSDCMEFTKYWLLWFLFLEVLYLILFFSHPY